MTKISVVSWEKGRIRLLDQTQLPTREKYIYCSDVKTLWEAIKNLRVRGAPAIGVAAALGVVLGLKNFKGENRGKFGRHLERICGYIGSSRPTAVNLFWALDRMKRTAEKNSYRKINDIKRILLKEAMNIIKEDEEMCESIGNYGNRLIRKGFRILTHCNAGALATLGIGTALAPIYKAHKEGKKVRVFADETRPLLQGSRLTAWELLRNGVDVTLICDNMSAYLMSRGEIDCVIVGADRIAENGDTANKIGTYGVAVLAKNHGIPFYVAAPSSTFDFSIKNGKQIPIETRKEDEIKEIYGKKIAPEKVKVYNPAFDVTPARYITAFITDKGILKKPDRKLLCI